MLLSSKQKYSKSYWFTKSRNKGTYYEIAWFSNGPSDNPILKMVFLQQILVAQSYMLIEYLKHLPVDV